MHCGRKRIDRTDLLAASGTGVSSALAVLPTFGEYTKAFELQATHLQKLFRPPKTTFNPKQNNSMQHWAKPLPGRSANTPGKPLRLAFG